MGRDRLTLIVTWKEIEKAGFPLEFLDQRGPARINFSLDCELSDFINPVLEVYGESGWRIAFDPLEQHSWYGGKWNQITAQRALTRAIENCLGISTVDAILFEGKDPENYSVRRDHEYNSI